MEKVERDRVPHALAIYRGISVSWWSNTLPYVVVLIVLVFFAQRLRMPVSLGQPYRKGET